MAKHNRLGGEWTENKIDILVKYAEAYLSIMNVHALKYNWKLWYFDGFAGSGLIERGEEDDRGPIMGAAKRISEITSPRAFDHYYFVEMDREKLESLKTVIDGKESDTRRFYFRDADCNLKIKDLAAYFKSNKGNKCLAFIDPCGMQLEWGALKELSGIDIDVWILVPTGMGVARLLKNDGTISDGWLGRLEIFLGMPRQDIIDFFYKTKKTATLFGDEESLQKEDRAAERSAELYRQRLKDIFKYVSVPFVLKNKKNSTMFHYIMATNNPTACKIADDIIGKY